MALQVEVEGRPCRTLGVSEERAKRRRVMSLPRAPAANLFAQGMSEQSLLASRSIALDISELVEGVHLSPEVLRDSACRQAGF